VIGMGMGEDDSPRTKARDALEPIATAVHHHVATAEDHGQGAVSSMERRAVLDLAARTEEANLQESPSASYRRRNTPSLHASVTVDKAGNGTGGGQLLPSNI
jgi:hypothetical protein